jgi:hypothetical protein
MKKKITKKTTASKKPAPEPQPTIGQYIDRRLFSMACNGDFGGNFSLSPASVAVCLISEYMSKWDNIRYE